MYSSFNAGLKQWQCSFLKRPGTFLSCLLENNTYGLWCCGKRKEAWKRGSSIFFRLCEFSSSTIIIIIIFNNNVIIINNKRISRRWIIFHFANSAHHRHYHHDRHHHHYHYHNHRYHNHHHHHHHHHHHYHHHRQQLHQVWRQEQCELLIDTLAGQFKTN